LADVLGMKHRDVLSLELPGYRPRRQFSIEKKGGIDLKAEGLKVSNEGVNGIKGYKFAGVSCGIKKSGREDLALIYSEVPAAAAAALKRAAGRTWPSYIPRCRPLRRESLQQIKARRRRYLLTLRT